MLIFQALPAGKGDCLVLRYGPAGERVVVIDGGPYGTYGAALRPQLMELRRQRRLAAERPLPLEAVIVSHVDDDHIRGLLDMTRELVPLYEREPLPFDVKTLWHNSFDDLAGEAGVETAVERAVADEGAAALAGIDGHHEAIFASIPQGRELRQAARRLGWTENSSLGLLSAETRPSAPIPLLGGLDVVVVGPRQPELDRLRAAHAAVTQRRAAAGHDPAAALAAFTDPRVPNLSSLVLLISHAGRTILATGDARGDHILLGLAEQELLGADGTLTVDVLKVMHHGSDRSVDTVFFRAVKAQHYVFSGNGEHGNPKRDCLRMLFDARPEGGFTLHFNYPPASIDERRRHEHEKQQRGKADAARDWHRDDALAAALEDFAKTVPFSLDVATDASGITIALPPAAT